MFGESPVPLWWDFGVDIRPMSPHIGSTKEERCSDHTALVEHIAVAEIYPEYLWQRKDLLDCVIYGNFGWCRSAYYSGKVVRIVRIVSAFSPASRSCVSVARMIPSMLPNSLSSLVRVISPTPMIRSSLEAVKALPRSLR